MWHRVGKTDIDVLQRLAVNLGFLIKFVSIGVKLVGVVDRDETI